MRIPVCLSVLLVLHATQAHAGEVRYENEVSIVQRNGCPMLVIKTSNVGEELMFLQPDEPLVLVVDPDGKELPYSGIIVNRPPYSVEELTRLYPGHVVSKEIDLLPSYKLRLKGRYRVSLGGDYYDPVHLQGYHNRALSTSFYYSGHCSQ